MTDKKENLKVKISEFCGKFIQNIPKIVAAITALATLFVPTVQILYKNYFVEPKIQCYPGEEEDSFKVSEEYRAVNLHLRPQLIVQYDNRIILCIYLKNYYEQESVVFTESSSTNETSGTAPKKNQSYVDNLRQSIYAGILKDAEKYNTKTVKEMKDQLHVYISTLGGVAYQHARGNLIIRQCIIGKENLVQDYGNGAMVISRRLNDMELDVEIDPANSAQKAAINQIICTVTDKICDRTTGKTEKGSHDIYFFLRLPKLLFMILILLCAIAVGVTVWKFLSYFKSLISRKKKGRRNKIPTIIKMVILFTVCFVVEGFSLSVAAYGLTATEDERYIYETTNLVKQKPYDVLFQPPPPPADVPEPSPEPLEKADETWPLPETLQRLHISENYVGADISQMMLETYRNNFQKIYINGSNLREGAVFPQWLNFDREAYQALTDETLSNILCEAEKCKCSSRPACLYQLFRALADAVYVEYANLPFEYLFDIAADAMACGELFLTYEDRNIADGTSVLVINSEDVALMNGKIYWTLASCLEYGYADQKYDIYRNCFYVAGFQCMAQGAEQAKEGIDGENDRVYAKMQYYMGNFSEKIVKKNRIPKEDALYKQMGEDALRHYSRALELLTTTGRVYDEEFNMRSNIQAGISTLEEMGFHLTTDSPT